MNFDSISSLTSMAVILPIVITVVVLGIMAVVFVPFILRLTRNASQNQKLLNGGMDAEAIIMQIAETGVRINEQPQVRIILEVHPANAPVFQSQATTVISYFQASQFQPGAHVQVKYDPSDMSKVAIAAVISNTGGAFGNSMGQSAGMVVPPTAATTIAMQDLARINAANMQLLETGEAAPATVMNIMPLGLMVNGDNPAVRFQLEVHPTNRPMFIGQSVGVISAASLPKFQPGATISVKFDPNDISRVTVAHS
jgi:type II secretory pathway pseudopilin PulG